MKTVYLLGAGASRGYRGSRTGIVPPLGKDYFSTFSKLGISADFEVKIGWIVNYVRDTRGIPPERQPTDFDENIESVFSEIDRELRAAFDESSLPARPELRSKAVLQRFNLSRAYDQFVFWFSHVLNEIQNGGPCEIYLRLIEEAGANGVFITFNWDTILDRALSSTGRWFPDDGYCVAFDGLLDVWWRKPVDSTSAYKLLKLHGSTNWFGPYVTRHLQTGRRDWVATPATVARHWCLVDGSKWFATYKDRWRPGYTPYSYFFAPNDPIADLPLMPVIIPPKEEKAFGEYASIFQPVWETARQELKDADRLIIIGYSFPVTDDHAYSLLDAFVSGRSRKLIEVVEPHPEEVKKRIVEQIGRKADVMVHRQTLGGFLGLLDERPGEAASEHEQLFARKSRSVKVDSESELREDHLVGLLTYCNLHQTKFDLTTLDGRRYLECTLPGEFATHLYGTYHPEVRAYRLSNIPVKPKGVEIMNIRLEDIWIVHPLRDERITDEEISQVDISRVEPSLVEMIRRGYHCVDDRETEWFVRRFLLS